ncbi:hypothetical protein NON20_07250 [Synechocystis sp. B12]|nr:hypothetical protein NON20_07250 [Synechocystis sp. B12]
MGVILAGTTSAVYIVGAFVQMVTEGRSIGLWVISNGNGKLLI